MHARSVYTGVGPRLAGDSVMITQTPFDRPSAAGVMKSRRTQRQRFPGALAARASSSGMAIESVGGVRPEVDAAIRAALGSCLTETDLGIGKKYTASSYVPL